MRTRTTTIGILATLALTLTACSSGGSDSKAAKATGTPPTASGEPAASSPTPATTKPDPAKPRTFGDVYVSEAEFEGTAYKGSIAVLGYEHDFDAQVSAAEEVNAEGYVWSALEVKVCALSDGISVSQLPWVLAYADGSRYEPSGVAYGDFPKPEYPFDGLVKNGDCVRGKIPFAVPGKPKPTKVIYTSEGASKTVEWAIPRG